MIPDPEPEAVPKITTPVPGGFPMDDDMDLIDLAAPPQPAEPEPEPVIVVADKKSKKSAKKSSKAKALACCRSPAAATAST